MTSSSRVEPTPAAPTAAIGEIPQAEFSPVPHEHLENALIVAALAHATAKTRKDRIYTWRRLQFLRQQQEAQRRLKA